MIFYKRALYLIISFILILTLSTNVFAEEASTVEDTSSSYEINITPENYATVLLSTSPTYHNSKDNVGVSTQYAFVNHTTISKAMRAYTFVSEFFIPLKSSLKSMTYNGKLYREGNKDSTLKIRYVNSEIKTDSPDSMPTTATGVYQGSYTQTVDTGETDADGNPITENKEIISETDKEYKNWYNYAYQFWKSETPEAGNVNLSGDFSLDFNNTAMAALKDGDSSYLTFGTSRVTLHSRYYYQSVPTLTLTYDTNDIISYANSLTQENAEEIIINLGKLGILDSDTATFSQYDILDEEFKVLVEKNMAESFPESGFTSFEEISFAFTLAMDLDNVLLNYLNSATEKNIRTVIKKLGESGKFSESTTDYTEYENLGETAKSEVENNMLLLIPENGFTSFSEVCKAFDKAMLLDTVSGIIYPKNYANVLLNTDPTYHNEKDDIDISKQFAYVNHKLSKTMRAYTFITEFYIPYKQALCEMNFEGNLYREGNKTSTLNIKYINSEIKTENESDMPTFKTGVYQGSYTQTVDTGETDADGNPITETEDFISETNEEYKKWYNYAYQFWTSQTKKAGSINQDSVFNIDLKENALSDLKKSDSSYLTFGTARISNSASRYYYQYALPVLKVDYIASELLYKIKNSTDDMSEILSTLGEAGLLEESEKKYVSYKILENDEKKVIAGRISKALSTKDCNKYSEFLSVYDEAFSSPVKSSLGDISIFDAENNEEYKSLSDSEEKNVILKVPVNLPAESKDYTAILSVYDSVSILFTDTKAVNNVKEISFELKMPKNAKKAKIMLWDSLSEMTPACEPATKPKETVLKIMTFNTQHCKNYNLGYVDYRIMADTIINSKPDIVGLNEMHGESSVQDYDDQTRILSELTGLNEYYFSKTRHNGAGPVGNSIISNYQILSTEQIMIPDPEEKTGVGLYTTRALLKVRLEGGITVIISHFGLNPDEHENAVKTALEHIEDEKCIFIGDFNMRPDNPILAPIQARMKDTADYHGENLYSYPSYAPSRKIDYIFVSNDIEVISADIPQVVAADHCPVVAELKIYE